MHPYLLVPLAACASNALLAGALLARGAEHRGHRVAALLLGGAAWWAVCEVLWQAASGADAALAWVRLSSLGWVALGPLGLTILMEAADAAAPRTRRALPALFGVSAVFAVLELATPWMHTGVEPTSWGVAYVFGPAYPLFYLFTLACIGRGLVFPLERMRRSPHPAERSQARVLLMGVAGPLAVASLTDGVLPWLGYQPPRLGTLSFGFLGAAVFWSVRRYGHWLLVPGNFAGEILETLSDGVALLRLDGGIRFANRALARLAGSAPAELEGRPVGRILPEEALAPGRQGRAVETSLAAAGGSPRPVAVSCAPLLDRQGHPIGRVLVVRDLREVAALRSRLVTSGRLAAVGELAAGIAHEINNPTAYVRSNLALLRKHWDAIEAHVDTGDAGVRALLEEGRELVDDATEGIDRIAATVRDVRSFSQTGGGGRERVDLNRLLEAVVRVTAPHLRYRARIESHLERVPLVAGRPQELQQVFTNLVLNAGEAIRDGGTIRIRTERAAEGGVRTTVEDDGCGIPAERLERVFDPFFTTRPAGSGAGLGLAIGYQIVQQHGGDISVQSEPGRGTRVRVWLRAA